MQARRGKVFMARRGEAGIASHGAMWIGPAGLAGQARTGKARKALMACLGKTQRLVR